MAVNLRDRARRLVLLALCCMPLAAAAQAYPNRPIRVVIPYTAGGAADAIARPIFDKMGEILGQPVLAVNQPGVNGELGTANVATANPDGYTLLFATTGPNVNSIAMGRPVRYTAASFQPITMVADSPSLLVVRSSLGIRNLAELIAYAKANPGKLNYGTLGTGSIPQLGLKSLNLAAGVDIKEIPYPGVAGAVVDILAERVDLVSSVVVSILPHIESGKLRPIALVTNRRSSILPDVPTISEQVPAYPPISSWLGLMAPAGTPRDVVDRLYKATVEAVRSPGVAEAMRRQGMSVPLPSPDEFAEQIRKDVVTWTEQFKVLGMGKE